MIKKIVWTCLDQNLNKNNSTYKEEDNSGNKLAIILAYHFGFKYFEEQLEMRRKLREFLENIESED